MLCEGDRNGNGTEKGKDDRPLGTQSCCGLSFSCCRRLEAGWGSCNGSDVCKDRVRAMVPHPDRLAGSDSRDWAIYSPLHPLCGGNAGCRDGERYWLPSHNPGRKPPPTDCSSSSHKPYRLAEQKHLTVGSAVNLNRTSAWRGQDKFVREVLEANMKIGVSGASGHLGRAVVSELLQRAGGHEVVAITRTPETVSGPAQGRFGDYNRPESLAEAYAGLDRLLTITTVDPEPGKRGAQNVAAIDAAVKAGVKHIVFMSAVGTRQEEEPARGASY